MSSLTQLDPDLLHRILLTLCYLLIALGILKLALFVLMTLTPSLWEKLIKKENALYRRLGILSEKGSQAYLKMERSVWTKAFLGCGGIATIVAALIVIAIAHWMQSFISAYPIH
ncbi:MAG: efflux RND transporter permease subunit [Verrucomicrobiales bacterium]|nr:efflux RND transporter permease subunit [Verrucomicrobiales bacterium]